MMRGARLRIRAACLLLCAFCAPPAFANGSMQCEGVPYSAEIQFRLSTGELTELIVARTNGANTASERFTLRQRFVDHERQVMRIEGAGLDHPARKATLNASKTRGTLTYRGAQYRLRCDWSDAG